MVKQFVRIIKKKIKGKRIFYKIQWSNEAISLEPLIQMEQDLLRQVEEWELQQLEDQELKESLQKKIKIGDIVDKFISQGQDRNENSKVQEQNDQLIQTYKPMQMKEIKQSKKQKSPIINQDQQQQLTNNIDEIEKLKVLFENKFGITENEIVNKMYTKVKDRTKVKESKKDKIKNKQKYKEKGKPKQKKEDQEIEYRNQTLNISQSLMVGKQMQMDNQNQNKNDNENDNQNKKINYNLNEKQKSIDILFQNGFEPKKNDENQKKDELFVQNKELKKASENFMSIDDDDEATNILQKDQEANHIKSQNQIIKKHRQFLCTKAVQLFRIESEERQNPNEDILKEKKSDRLNNLDNNRDNQTIQNKTHQPKKSMYCQIISARRQEAIRQLEFLVKYDGQKPIWSSQGDLRNKSPRELCEYLMNRISWGQIDKK